MTRVEEVAVRRRGRLRLALASAAVALLVAPAAFAEGLREQTAQAERTYGFSIPAQPLPQALIRFSEQSGIELAFDASLARDLSTGGIDGTYTAEEALSLLLAGTGLGYRFTNPTTVTLLSAGDESGTIHLPALIITGEKIERSYQDTFTSVGVVDGEQLDTFQITTLQQAFELLANVRQFPGNSGNNSFVIRGLSADGVTQPTNAAPLTSIVIDGATQNGEGNRRGARVLWDVEQVEVFRGPQSTLQGRNALAGTVAIKTNDPTYFWQASAQGIAGTEDTLQGGLVLSGPIIEDQVAFRISGIWHSSERGIEYADPANKDMDDDEYHQVRGKVLIEPEGLPGFSLLLTAASTHDKPGVYTVSGPDYFDKQYDAVDASVEFREIDLQNYVAEAAYELGDFWTLRSITAFVDTDLDISTAEGGSYQRDDLRDGFDVTQELRVEFADETRPLSGVAGVFYGHYNQDTDSLIGYSLPFIGDILVQDADFGNETTSYAAFADARWRFYDGFSLLLGGRVQHDKVRSSANGTFLNLDNFTYYDEAYEATTSYTVFLPRIGIAYDFNPLQSLAFTASRGYRAGFSEVVLGTPNTVQPEFLWDYELAYRGQFWDQRLVVGANIFYYDYKNQQVAVEDPRFPGTAVTENAGSSRAYGAELEARVNLDMGLQLFGSLGLLKTEFKDFSTIDGNFDGNEFPEAPTVTGSLGGIYRHHSGFFAAADVSYTGEYYSAADIENTSLQQIDPYTLVNARFGYDTRYFTVTLFADNLLNDEYLTSISSYGLGTIGDGRVVGLVVDLHY